MVNVVKNYELIENQKNFVLTYSLLDFNKLKNGSDLSMNVLEINPSSYNLFLISSEKTNECSFENFPGKLLDKLFEKRVLLVGFSASHDVEKVNTVSSINLIKKNKLKIGG